MFLLAQAGYACQWSWDYKIYARKELYSANWCFLLGIQQLGLLLGPWVPGCVPLRTAVTGSRLVALCLLLSDVFCLAKTRGFFLVAAIAQGALPFVAVTLLDLKEQKLVTGLWKVRQIFYRSYSVFDLYMVFADDRCCCEWRSNERNLNEKAKMRMLIPEINGVSLFCLHLRLIFRRAFYMFHVGRISASVGKCCPASTSKK